MIQSSSENSMNDLEKIEYKRQNAISDDESAEYLLVNNKANSTFSLKIKCIYLSVITISLVAIIITVLILTGKLSS